MQKIMTFAIDDLIIDPQSVADQLTKLCSTHRPRYRVRGLCRIEDCVYFVLHAATATEPREQCVFAPIEDVSNDGFTSMLDQRWAAGFNSIGTIAEGEGTYLLLLTRTLDSDR